MAESMLSQNTDLVYDVGMHEGKDTAHYLRRGFRVVSFEANPELVAHNEAQFSEEIRSGRLTIVEGAIVENPASGDSVDFYLNHGNSQWGTVDPNRAEEYGTRVAEGVTTIAVPQIDFTEQLRERGVPYYLKTDIEGADIVCMRALRNITERPHYLSLESDVNSLKNVVGELALLSELGYNAFQVLNQKDNHKRELPGFPLEYGASGEFGPFLPAEDWMDQEHTIRKYRELFVWYKLFSPGGLLRDTPLQKPLTRTLSKLTSQTIPSWHDTHARHQELGQ